MANPMQHITRTNTYLNVLKRADIKNLMLHSTQWESEGVGFAQQSIKKLIHISTNMQTGH